MNAKAFLITYLLTHTRAIIHTMHYGLGLRLASESRMETLGPEMVYTNRHNPQTGICKIQRSSVVVMMLSL